MVAAMPTTLSEQAELLTIFVESVDEVLDSHFVKQAAQGGLMSESTWSKEGVLTQERVGPELDAVKALLLTVRMFSQPNDPTSFENISTMVSTMPVSQTLKDRFDTSVTNFNSYLDSPPPIGFSVERADTQRSIFKTFLYGSFAHTTPSKRRRLKAWKASSEYNDLRLCFDRILFEFVKASAALRSISLEVLQEVPS